MLTDVMTLENPVNGSSRSVGTDHPGHKAKGETCPLQRAKLSLMAACKRYKVKSFTVFVLLSCIQMSSLDRSVVCLVKTSPAYLGSSGDSVWLCENCPLTCAKW